MDELQFIVERLSCAPFNKPFRAVDFDEKSPNEHLQILCDVLKEYDSNIRLKSSSRDQITDCIVQFLQIHKCDCIPSCDNDELVHLIDGIRQGKKKIIYPILYWILSNHEYLTKRSYLSSFLMPINVPVEYLNEVTNPNLEELVDVYKELQVEFVETHKQYEATASSEMRQIPEIFQSTKQLGSIKKNLLKKIEREKSQKGMKENFQQILETANKMREAREDEIRLEEQKIDQIQSMAIADRRLKQVHHIYNVLGNVVTIEESSIEEVLTRLEEESRKSVNKIENELMSQRQELELKLHQTQKELAGFISNDVDMEQMENLVNVLDDELAARRQELESFNRDRNAVNRLATFKQHVNVAIAKLQAKEEALKNKQMERELLMSTNQSILTSIEHVDRTLEDMRRPDGTSISQSEFKKFQDGLAVKRKCHENSKIEIDSIETELLVLENTAKILKSRHHNLEKFLKKQEEKAGILGFRYTHNQLEDACKQTSLLNELKSQTLQEISEMVQKIALTLEDKKKLLEPKVNQLKQARRQFQEIVERYNNKKSRYDKLANKLVNNNKKLENECSRLKALWLEKDRNYHLLLASDEMVSSKLDTVTMEDAWRSGEESFLPDFACLKDFYESKLTQLQGLSMELRKQQSCLTETEAPSSYQKVMFSNLKKLLHLKLKSQCEKPPIDDVGIFEDMLYSKQ